LTTAYRESGSGIADAHVADAAVLGSGEAGEEGGFSALISSLADETALRGFL